MQDGCDRPPCCRQGITSAGTQPVDERPGTPMHKCVSQSEGEDYSGIGPIAHVEMVDQYRCDDRKSLAVKIINRCRQKDQQDHKPSEVGATRGHRILMVRPPSPPVPSW